MLSDDVMMKIWMGWSRFDFKYSATELKLILEHSCG